MTSTAGRFAIAGAVFVLFALFCFFCDTILHAQEVTELVPSSSSKSNLSATEVKDKVADAIEGIKTGDISAAKEAVVFDKLLSYTLIRISDCWTLCKQEMLLAKECARQEAIRTAKDIFTKGKDAAMGQGREAILDALPLLSTVEKDDLSDTPSASASSTAAAPGSSNDPAKIRESIQNQLGTPYSSETDPAKMREAVQNHFNP